MVSIFYGAFLAKLSIKLFFKTQHLFTIAGENCFDARKKTKTYWKKKYLLLYSTKEIQPSGPLAIKPGRLWRAHNGKCAKRKLKFSHRDDRLYKLFSDANTNIVKNKIKTISDLLFQTNSTHKYQIVLNPFSIELTDRLGEITTILSFIYL